MKETKTPFKIEDTTFFKKHILGPYLKEREKEPFEAFLPFDPTVIDVYQDDEIIDEPILTHVVMHFMEALYPERYFVEEDLQDVLHLLEGEKNGRVKIYQAM